MGLKMAEYEPHPVSDYFIKPDPPLFTAETTHDPPFLPYWARCRTQCAQNLLDFSDEPIEYDHDDEDYRDNCFFFPEDCSWSPPKDWVLEAHRQTQGALDTTDTMIPGLPDIKMLDSEALGDLLEDNLSPPEITTMLVFATNGAIFAYASSLPSRQLRNLSATYGAAYTCYAKTASSGNLTAVNPASHPSSYVTAQSMSLGDLGSIVFELDDSVAVVTRIADKVLLAAVGPSKLDPPALNGSADADHLSVSDNEVGAPVDSTVGTTPEGSQGAGGPGTPSTAPTSPNPPRNGAATTDIDTHLETQHEIDRTADLERLSSLSLSASPAVLLAMESKCAALGRFLGQKLDDLESPDDF